MEGIEMRELPPRDLVVSDVTYAREIRLAYEHGARDRFAALIAGIVCGAAGSALICAAGFWLF